MQEFRKYISQNISKEVMEDSVITMRKLEAVQVEGNKSEKRPIYPRKKSICIM